MTPIHGTELYRYQDKVDYVKMGKVEGLRFCYIKATQGVAWTDPKFFDHYRGLRDNTGIDIGVLHFMDTHNYQAGQEIAFGRQQAEYHWRVVEKTHGSLPDCADTETNEGEGVGWEVLNALTAPRILKITLHYHLRMKELSGKFGIDYCSGWLTDHMKNFGEGGAFLPRYKSLKAERDMWVNNVLVKKGKYYQPPIDHFLNAEELATYLKPYAGIYGKPLITQYASLLSGMIIGCPWPIDADYVEDEAMYALLKSKAIDAPSTPIVEDGPVYTTTDLDTAGGTWYDGSRTATYYFALTINGRKIGFPGLSSFVKSPI